MILNILASTVLAFFIALNLVGTLQMLQGPYDEKPKWLALSLLKILAFVFVFVAVWL